MSSEPDADGVYLPDAADARDELEAEVPVSTHLLLGATSGAVTWQFVPISPFWALLSVALWWLAILVVPAAASRAAGAALSKVAVTEEVNRDP